MRRARLLAACLELFGTRGYAATTIERICTTARVSTQHFYQLYGNKEAAFIDLYDELTASSYRKVMASLEETVGKPLRERVPEAFVAYLSPMLSDERVARIAFVEVMGVSPRIEEVRLRYREMLVELVRAEGTQAVARGEVRDRDWRFAALALAGTAITIGYDWMVQQDRAPARQLEQALMKFATDLLTN